MARDKKRNDVGGMAFVGCILVGLALGILYNETAVGVLLGVGIGFLAMALIKAATRKR